MSLVPGTQQAENYDVGGESVAYHDLTMGNELGAYRTDSVDIEVTTDATGGYQLGHTSDGEWLEYTVNVSATGVYSLDARVASATAMQFHLYIDGTDVATVDVAASGGWTTWTTASKTGIALTAGQHVIRFAFTSSGFCVNWLRFTGATTVTPRTSNVAAKTLSGSTTCYTLNGKNLTQRAVGASRSQAEVVITQTSIGGRCIIKKMILTK